MTQSDSISLVVFDAFSTLVTAHPQSKDTFRDGLEQAGLDPSQLLMSALQAASEGLDHSAWSGSRKAYVGWATETLRTAGQLEGEGDTSLTGRIIPALEQLHQAPMVQMPGASACLARLRTAGYIIAVCSNWGWDLRADLDNPSLGEYVDIFITSAQVGVRKPHPKIYYSVLNAAGVPADRTIFVGDNVRTDVLGPQSVGIRSILLSSSPADAADCSWAGSLAAVSSALST